MNLSRPFIERPVMTTLVMLAILFFGAASYFKLPISDLPSIEFPTIIVLANDPGSDPQTMADNIATPIEQELMMIPGLSAVVSQSINGATTITCQFDLDMQLSDASTWVASALTQAQGNLPVSQMPELPYYQRFNPSDSPIIYLAVSSDSMTMGDLYNYASTAVAQRLSMLSGVAQVNVYGAKEAIRVKIDPDQCFYRGLGINEVADALKAASQRQPAGTVYNDVHQVTLEPYGQLTKASQYEDLMIAYRDGGPVRVRDIGRAIDSSEIDVMWTEYWNRQEGSVPSIVINILRQPGANTVAVTNQIIEMLPEINNQLPGAVNVELVHNGADPIKSAVWDVKFTLIVAFLLVVLVIFLFLGNLTSTIIPSCALPMSIIGTFIFMLLFGYSIDILSMMALTLVVGFLVDDAIVVLENIVRHMDMGKSPKEAALDGSRQISMTVLSMSLSLSAIFIPIMFMPGIIGRMFHEFAVVVVVAVLFSCFISLTLTPLLCAKALRPVKRENFVHKMSNKIMETLNRWYEPLLVFCLKRGWIPVALTAGSCVVALFLLVTTPQDFLPAGDTGVIQALTFGLEGAAPEAMTELEKSVANVIKDNSAVEKVIAVANVTTMFPANQSASWIILKPEVERAPIAQVAEELIEATRPILNQSTYFKPFPEINLSIGATPTRAEYTYALSTMDNPEQLYLAAAKLTEAIMKEPEFIDVSSDMMTNNPQLNFTMKRDQATTFGVSVDTIETAMALAYAEGQLDQYSTPISTYWVILELEDRFKADVNSLDKIWLKGSSQDQLVPMRSVADWEIKTGPLAVNHVNQFTSASIYFNLAPGAALGTAVNKVHQLAAEIVPETVIKSFQGEAQVFEGTMPTIVALMFVGFVVIYMLLGILYESFIHPITILSALPGALFGAMVTLTLFGATLSLYSYIGIIVLVGIVMKNGIMLVEFAKVEVDRGKDPFTAIHDAALTRFRPILMTTVAAAMGAVPIALGIGAGSASRQPLGLVIVGGLIFAQLITYFFTPVIYLWFEYLQEWVQRRRAAKRGDT